MACCLIPWAEPVLRLIAILGLLSGGAWLGLGRIERAAVYPFDPARVPPAEAGLEAVREYELRGRGATLVLWVAQPAPGRPTVLYFHGNAGNLANRAERFAQFTGRGYGLIAPAYRGSSGSSGRPSERTLSRDAQRVYDGLGRFVPGLTPAGTVVFGESLGSAVALKLLAQRPEAPPAAVVLEAPFTSLPDIVRHHYPALRPLLWRMTNVWNSRRHTAALSAPLLVLHGTDDDVVPIDQGREIFAAAGSDDKRFVAVPGAGHQAASHPAGQARLWRFLERDTTSIR